jgi:hypothetical protein
MTFAILASVVLRSLRRGRNTRDRLVHVGSIALLGGRWLDRRGPVTPGMGQRTRSPRMAAEQNGPPPALPRHWRAQPVKGPLSCLHQGTKDGVRKRKPRGVRLNLHDPSQAASVA